MLEKCNDYSYYFVWHIHKIMRQTLTHTLKCTIIYWNGHALATILTAKERTVNRKRRSLKS